MGMKMHRGYKFMMLIKITGNHAPMSQFVILFRKFHVFEYQYMFWQNATYYFPNILYGAKEVYVALRG